MTTHICNICGNEFTGRKKKYCSQDCLDEARRISNRERWRTNNPGWNEGINKVCVWCGQVYTVPARNAHIAKFCSEECQQVRYNREVREHGPMEEYIEERKEQAQERQARLEKERLERVVVKDCVWCGDLFETTDTKRLTCSSECSRKRANRIKWERKEARLNEKNTIDKDITLIMLYKKDKGICHICNEPCDYDDKQITEEGHFIAGGTYPSVDHVIPIAKGGKHSWNNVKLAHHKCNGIKSDRIIDNKTLV